MSENFYTLSGYNLTQNKQITYSMEDYLEMLYRIEQNEKITLKKLADKLNVTPPSATKMVTNLCNAGLCEREKYKPIKLTDKGREKAKYLIKRHEAINKLLCLINSTDTELEETEKIEHYLSERTVNNIISFIEKAAD